MKTIFIGKNIYYNTYNKIYDELIILLENRKQYTKNFVEGKLLILNRYFILLKNMNMNKKYKEEIEKNNIIITNLIKKVKENYQINDFKPDSNNNKHQNKDIKKYNENLDNIYIKIKEEIEINKENNVEYIENENLMHYENEYLKNYIKLVKETNGNFPNIINDYLVKLEISTNNDYNYKKLLDNINSELKELENKKNINKNSMTKPFLEYDFLSKDKLLDKIKESFKIFEAEYLAIVERIFNKTELDFYPRFKRKNSGYLFLDEQNSIITINQENVKFINQIIHHEFGHAIMNELILLNIKNKYSDNKINNHIITKEMYSININIVINETNAIIHELLSLVSENKNIYDCIGHLISNTNLIIKHYEIYNCINQNDEDEKLFSIIKEEIKNIESNYIKKMFNKEISKDKINIVTVLENTRNYKIDFSVINYFFAVIFALQIIEKITNDNTNNYIKKYIDTIKNSNNMSIKEFIEILELKY